MSERRSGRHSGAGESAAQSFDAVVVGAGFAGMYMLHRLRGLGLSARVFERGDGVGGTWYWNRYPGARCDIESLEYSYQFSEELQQEWDWSERYATQPEILSYANHVADRFDLLPDIQFETQVQAAHFDEDAARWNIDVADQDGSAAQAVSARFLIMATGCLSSTNTPDFPGLSDFEGDVYHTGAWPHEGVDFTGKRVGIVGTGSSAIQSIPLIAQEAEHLHVFQRTPNFTVPAHNGPIPAERVAEVKAHYPAFRAANWKTASGANFKVSEVSALSVSEEERQAEYEVRWADGGLGFMSAYMDVLMSKEANATAGDFIRSKITEVVEDPQVAEMLSPEQVVGCKRLCVDTGYWATFNRDNVTLVDVKKAPIEAITPTGLRTSEGAYDFDCLILATGFDAMTGAITKVDIQGVGGTRLTEKWAAGPRMYLGLGAAGFPNLFTITGPGSPSVLSNMIPSIEQHVNWIADCIGYMGDRGLSRIEAQVEAEDAWVEHVNAVASLTLYPTCNSWYLGANVPGKPRVFMPYLGFATYVEKCEDVVSKGYEGFALSG